GQRVARGGHEPERLVLRRGLRLADDELSGAVHDERVGHRASGVDCEDPWVGAVGGGVGGHRATRARSAGPAPGYRSAQWAERPVGPRARRAWRRSCRAAPGWTRPTAATGSRAAAGGRRRASRGLRTATR